MYLKKMTFKVNGVERAFVFNPEKDTLATVLRRYGLTGVKVGCGIGVCGACSVILDGKVIRSCTKKMRTMKEYSTITTIEGIGAPHSLHPLQVAFMNCGAVQCGFCSPGFIVSAYALLQENVDPTREEVRDWFQKHKNICRCTGYKQIVDAVMAAASVLRGEKTIEDITFKYPEDGDIYGKPLVRPNALGKVTGITDYGEDVALKMPAGTLHAVMYQPKVTHHAKITKLDLAEAENMPGVVKVVTYKDCKGTNHLNLAAATKRSITMKPTHPVIAEDKIYRYGDCVAVVVADTEEHARAALSKIDLEIEQLPEYMNYLDAVVPDAMQIIDNTPNICTSQPVLKGIGLESPTKVDKLIDSSAYVVEGSFYSSREPHLSIEGDTVQAYFDENEVLTIQCKSEGVYGNLNHVSKAVGMPIEKVRIIMNPTGGSFGWSTSAISYAIAGITAVAVHEPVALHFTYEEHQHLSGKRAPAYTNVKLGCDADGRITGVEYDCGMDHGAYQNSEFIVYKPARFMLYPYNVPNVAGLVRIATTNHSFTTAYRGFGSPQIYTAGEAIVDMMAEKIGMDPFAFRFKNIARPGDLNLNSYTFPEYPVESIMEKMRPFYERAVKEAMENDTPEIRRGVGIAMGGYNVTEGPDDECTVAFELMPDNTITKYDTWEDVGQGGDQGALMTALVALKPLGVRPEDIHLVQNDTATCPDSGYSASSRQHYMACNASVIAAEKLMDAMRKDDGTYRTYEEMVAEGIETKHFGTFSCTSIEGLCDIDPNTGIGNPYSAYNYAMYLAEVAVEAATGKTTVLRYICVDDVGVVGNIDALNGQAFGGMSHCIGFALSENYEDVKKHTNVASAGIPNIKDVPDAFEVYHLENPRANNAFGSSGASECYQSSGHMAIINAINNACGVRIHELPATAAKVKAGIDALAKGEKPYAPDKYFLGGDLIEDLEDIKANPI